MSYTAITTSEITTGEPTTNTTATKIKDNFDDHETRLVTLEVGHFEKQYELITGWEGGTGAGFGHSGSPSGSTYQGMFYDVFETATTFVSVDCFAYDGTASGETIDILRSTNGGGSWTSILTAPMTVSGTAFTIVTGTLSGSLSASFPANSIIRVDGTFSGAAPSIKVRYRYR